MVVCCRWITAATHSSRSWKFITVNREKLSVCLVIKNVQLLQYSMIRLITMQCAFYHYHHHHHHHHHQSSSSSLLLLLFCSVTTTTILLLVYYYTASIAVSTATSSTSILNEKSLPYIRSIRRHISAKFCINMPPCLVKMQANLRHNHQKSKALDEKQIADE